LILAGAIGTVVGLNRGISHGGPPLIAGLAAVVIGTAEVTLREHLSGYRSHTLILALLPTIVFHSAVVLIVAAFTTTPRALNVALLFLDAAIFAFLFKLLRARFQDARRERVFAGRR
jgi:cytochrome c biogenesis factor